MAAKRERQSGLLVDPEKRRQNPTALSLVDGRLEKAEELVGAVRVFLVGEEETDPRIAFLRPFIVAHLGLQAVARPGRRFEEFEQVELLNGEPLGPEGDGFALLGDVFGPALEPMELLGVGPGFVDQDERRRQGQLRASRWLRRLADFREIRGDDGHNRDQQQPQNGEDEVPTRPEAACPQGRGIVRQGLALQPAVQVVRQGLGRGVAPRRFLAQALSG